MGRAARTGPNSLLGEPQSLPRESPLRNVRPAFRGRNVRHGGDRQELSADQGPGLSLERRPNLGRPLGLEWADQPRLVLERPPDSSLATPKMLENLRPNGPK